MPYDLTSHCFLTSCELLPKISVVSGHQDLHDELRQLTATELFINREYYGSHPKFLETIKKTSYEKMQFIPPCYQELPMTHTLNMKDEVTK